MRLGKVLSALAFLMCLAGVAAAQSPPDLVNYQGTLLRPDGSPEVGPKTLEFRIVDEGNTVVWGPQTFPDLPIQQGRFNVLLGATDDSGSTITLAFRGSGDAARYLSVRIAGEPAERLPLQRIASVPWALNVPDASIGTEKISAGAVTKDKLAPQTVWIKDIPTEGVVFDILAKVPQNTLTEIPGLELTVSTSGSGRPLFIGLRRKPNSELLNGEAKGEIVVNPGYDRDQIHAIMGFVVDHGTTDYYQTRFAYGVGPSDALMHSVPYSDLNAIALIPSGVKSVNIKVFVRWSSQAGRTPFIFSLQGPVELYAFEM